MAKNNKTKLTIKGRIIFKDENSPLNGSELNEITIENENNLDTTKVVAEIFKSKDVQKIVKKFCDDVITELE